MRVKIKRRIIMSVEDNLTKKKAEIAIWYYIKQVSHNIKNLMPCEFRDIVYCVLKWLKQGWGEK